MAQKFRKKIAIGQTSEESWLNFSMKETMVGSLL